MQDNERDILTLTDDDGNEIELEVLRFFFYNGEEYAMVTELSDEQDEEESGCAGGCAGCAGCGTTDVFFMKVEPVDEENEEFTFVDELLSEELMKVIDAEYDEEGAPNSPEL